ncbi:Basic form of pathogenesis-related protein 1 [Sesamum angolense]|uniref:Basic form of pathogenesis-related protein 1 n=1 Tax=Sesamum angolense TaxID=2727404 RepID=A0AAE1X4S6_9LAMI|nr:Basic form of pathogenesis-related protein 1 [Sesamum angolense]
MNPLPGFHLRVHQNILLHNLRIVVVLGVGDKGLLPSEGRDAARPTLWALRSCQGSFGRKRAAVSPSDRLREGRVLGFPFSLIANDVCLMLALQLACAQNSPEDFLEAHNAGRAQVGVPPLAWKESLVAYAQDYAKQRSEDCAMKHSDGPYGENLAKGSWDVTAKEAVQMWLDEKKFYDEGSNSCIGEEMCGHYTQVVWRGSAHVGCARTKCSNGWTFVTCNYDPPALLSRKLVIKFFLMEEVYSTSFKVNTLLEPGKTRDPLGEEKVTGSRSLDAMAFNSYELSWKLDRHELVTMFSL